MQIKTSLLGLAVCFVASLPIQSAVAADQFQPGEGEPVKLWHHSIKAGHMDQAQAFFLKVLLPRIEAANAARDTYFLVNEKENKIVAVSFRGKHDDDLNPNASTVDEGMRAHAAEPRRKVDYKLILVNDEPFVPQLGDKVMLMSRKVKFGKLEQAEQAMREVIFPHLAKDEFNRDSYLLENSAGNALVSLVFLRGEFSVSSALAAKRDENLKPHLSEPEMTTEYTIFGIINH
jgi:hypothetical protein